MTDISIPQSAGGSVALQGPHARVDAEPAVLTALVGVDVSAVAPRSSRSSGRHDRGVAVHVQGHLVDGERPRRVALEIVDVPVMGPDLAGGSVQIREGGGEDRLKQLPGTLAERVDESEVEIRQFMGVVHRSFPFSLAARSRGTGCADRSKDAGRIRTRPTSCRVRIRPVVRSTGRYT